MIKIITDSSSNISQEEAKAWGITVIPLTISFGNEEFRDGVDIKEDEFYLRLTSQKEFPHTSQLSEELIKAACEEGLKEADEVLILPLAAALSGSYERACNVASKYKNVYVHDTKATTVMLKMLVLEALQNKEKSAEEVIDILYDYRPRLRIYAALNTLEYLRKGGRLSSATALIGSVLKIKPVITFDGEGGVQLISKQFGFNKAINYIAETVDKSKIDFTKPIYRIYTMNGEHSEMLFEKLEVTPTEVSNICPVIGCHIGPEAAGFVYAEKN